jgi:hypothetical protein
MPCLGRRAAAYNEIVLREEDCHGVVSKGSIDKKEWRRWPPASTVTRVRRVVGAVETGAVSSTLSWNLANVAAENFGGRIPLVRFPDHKVAGNGEVGELENS